MNCRAIVSPANCQSVFFAPPKGVIIDRSRGTSTSSPFGNWKCTNNRTIFVQQYAEKAARGAEKEHKRQERETARVAISIEGEQDMTADFGQIPDAN